MPDGPPLDKLELATEETYLRMYQAQETRATRTVLACAVGGETYGVDIRELREIIKPRPVTEVPRTPDWLLGVVSVRGVIVPILDLRLRLGLPAHPPTRAARILVVHKGSEPYGLLVDAVADAVHLVEDDIEPPPLTLAAAEHGFIAGIGRHGGGKRSRTVILLSIDQVVHLDLLRGRQRGSAR
jgi:purine-binding chemotaxis protein CheW